MKLIFPFLILFTIYYSLFTPVASATVSCTATVSPSTVYTGSNDTYTISLTNSSSESINWVRVTVPSLVYWQIDTFSNPSGWTGTNTNDEYITYTGGSISASGSLSISLVAGTGDDPTVSTAWTVQVSDDAGGASPVSCTGSLGTSVVAAAAAPAISNISVSDITDSEAKFTWTTNVAANSIVQYGTSTSYGSTKTDSTSTTSHSVTLTGLSTNTTYHYKLQSTGSSGTTGESSDGTFFTSKQQSTTVTITTADSTAPVLSVPTDTSIPFPTPPTVSGTATDNIGVTIVEYSITGGNIYTKATLASAGAQSSAFNFTLPKLADGTYTLKIRARDAAANTGNYKDIKFTIDTTGPIAKLTTDLSRPFTSSPKTTGSVTDPAGVSTVEYSIDAGISFSPAILTKNTFTFVPPALDDGNYPIQIRATDSVGNSQLSTDNWQLVIDRLPPKIAHATLTLDSTPLFPDSSGIYLAPAGAALVLSVSIIGGPVSASLSLDPDHTFSLSPQPDQNYWQTTIPDPQVGQYDLVLDSTDGAANHTRKSLGSLNVLPRGRILSAAGSIPTSAHLTLFKADPTSNTFSPYLTPPTPQDSYFFLLPTGKYYLQVSSPGFQSSLSEIFDLSVPTFITQDITLTPLSSLNLWARFLALFHPPTFMAPPPRPPSPSAESPSPFPEFYLTTGSNSPPFTHLALRGSPTLVSVLDPNSSLGPYLLLQLKDLNASHPDLHQVIILPQATIESAEILKSRASLPFPVLADPDNILADSLGYFASPTHYFLNNQAVIIHTHSSYLSAPALSNLLSYY